MVGENYGFVSFLNITLWSSKFIEFDVCGRPLFVNPVFMDNKTLMTFLWMPGPVALLGLYQITWHPVTLVHILPHRLEYLQQVENVVIINQCSKETQKQ